MSAVPINYLAVLIAALVAIGLGFAWFGPLFGKMWMEASGVTQEKVEAMGKNPAMMRRMQMGYGWQALVSLVMAFVLAHAIFFAKAYLGVTGLSAGLQGGFWNWLGFIVPVSLGAVLWDGKPWKYFYIVAGYYLVALLLMGVVIGLMQA